MNDFIIDSKKKIQNFVSFLQELIFTKNFIFSKELKSDATVGRKF